MSTIVYPKTWVAEVLTFADLNAQFAAVNGITGITTGQLGVGASINAFQSAAFTPNVTAQNSEATVLTLPSIATRGGRVLVLPFGVVSVTLASSSVGTCSLRWKRAGVTMAQIDVVLQNVDLTAAILIPWTVPPFVDSVAAGSYVYTLTAVSPNTGITISTGSSNTGLGYAIEFA